MKSEKRIDTLDGYRSLAILSVMLFHFYSRYNFPDSSYGPYDPLFQKIFAMGFFGVKFFFIISGFVIFYTLEKSNSLSVFFLKRMAKLFPPILLCSLLTYFLVGILDPAVLMPEFHSLSPMNFLPSLTFTSPTLWNSLLGVNNIKFINGSYWSLYVEVSFYIIAGFLFFFNKTKFASNWIRLIGIVTLIRFIAVHLAKLPHLQGLVAVAFAYEKFHWVYFTLGIFFYCLYFSKPLAKIDQVIVLLISLYQFRIYDFPGKIAFLVTILFFVAFVYKSEYLGFFRTKWITRIGVISYSLYLIHEYLGVIIINKLDRLTTNIFIIRMIPILVGCFLIGVAELMYRFYEKPLHNLTRQWIDGKKKPASLVPEKNKMVS